jgi:hypothetical protein
MRVRHEFSPRVLGGSRFGWKLRRWAHSRKCQTSTATPAEPGGLSLTLGHLRHEVGHFYWDLLIAHTNLKMPFRAVFGDESVDYQTALSSYHNRGDRSFDRAGFISEYATSHPWEDWAETFAHFLHIVSTLDSAGSLPLLLNDRARQTLRDPYREEDFDALLASWTPIAEALNELNRSVGQSDAYPFELSPIVNGKLHFVHMAIASYRERMRRGLQRQSAENSVGEDMLGGLAHSSNR